MEKLLVPIELRLGAQGVAPQPLCITQGDRGAVRLVISPKNMHDVCADFFYARLVFTRADGLAVIVEPETVDGTLCHTLGAAEVDVPGEVVGCVQWFGEDARVTSARFSFKVEPDPARHALDVGENALNALEELAARCELAIASMRAEIEALKAGGSGGGGVDAETLATLVRQGGDATLKRVEAETVLGAVWQ